MKKIIYWAFASLFLCNVSAMTVEERQEHAEKQMCELYDKVLDSCEMPSDEEIEEVATECFNAFHDTDSLSMIFIYHSPENLSGTLKRVALEFRQKFINSCYREH
jgi:hypothetical protein